MTTKEPPDTSKNNLVKVVIGLWAGVLLGVAVIGILIWTGIIPLLGNSNDRAGLPPQEAPLAKLESGTPAPDVAMTGLDGAPVHVADFKGKIVVMNFWATWCGPCVREMPMFQEYQDRYPNIVLLGVDQAESADKVKEFLNQLSLTYKIVLDEKSNMGNALRVEFLPTTMFINEKGEIRFRHYGILNEQQMDYYLGTLGVTIQGATSQ